ncbi:MAG: ankyrin repeat domain-containing protein [Candidatus Poribacteria bacterium]|nr:ankyrin repeat domain-containing protein [Candidatus Poribacteria bacterium]
MAKSTKAPDAAKAIIRAAGAGDLDAVRELIASQIDLLNARNSDGSTPLHMAVWKGNTEVVRFLLEAGADVNAHNENTHWGTTPLHAAAHANRKAIAEMLLDHGAEINARNLNNGTPLGETRAHNATSAAKFLRERGATE